MVYVFFCFILIIYCTIKYNVVYLSIERNKQNITIMKTIKETVKEIANDPQAVVILTSAILVVSGFIIAVVSGI